MTVPTAYADWSEWLDVFMAGGRDEDVLAALGAGQMSWSPGVAEMFAKRMHESLEKRLTSSSDSLQKSMGRSSDETSLLRSIFDARRALWVLHRFATMPSLPELLKKHLSDAIKSFASRAQSSLEDSAKRDRTGRLSTLMRNNTLLSYATLSDVDPDGQPKPRLASAEDDALPTSGIRRRNFLV